MPQRPLEARGPVATGVPRPHNAANRGITLRDALVADIGALVVLINAAYKPRDGKIFPYERTDPDDIAAGIDAAVKTIIVAEIDGIIAASVHLDITPPEAHFGPLATSVAHQGRGLAPALIAECERRARAAGCDVMRIGIIREVGLQPYYEALGYRYASETPGQELTWGQNTTRPFTLVHMEKALP